MTKTKQTTTGPQKRGYYKGSSSQQASMGPMKKIRGEGSRTRPTSSPSPAPAEITFSTQCFWEWYNHLKMKQCGQFHTVDWQVLEHLGLDEEIKGFFSTWGWTRLFDITEDKYKVATLELLSTIEMNLHLTSFDRAGSIWFQLFGVQRTLSYVKFALLLGLYDSEFFTTPAYDQFLIGYSWGKMASPVWR